ncbi:MAG TPA: HAD hydrolase family protein, partial [Actinomycetota bacterium]
MSVNEGLASSLVKLARDHAPELVRTLKVRRVYADLDGTLLGPGGSLFAHPDGVTGEPAEALVALAQAGIDLVLVSGRTRDQVREVARAVGAAGYVAEVGGQVVNREGWGEAVTRLRGAFGAAPGTPYEAIQRTGAAGLLLTAFPGRLEPHTPWSDVPRECSVLLRGNVNAQEADDVLDRSGYGWLEVLDNGIISAPPGRYPGLETDEVHVYHLVPKGVSKAGAIAVDRERVGLGPDGCIAVGDSATDLAAAGEVGAVFLVANGEPA